MVGIIIASALVLIGSVSISTYTIYQCEKKKGILDNEITDLRIQFQKDNQHYTNIMNHTAQLIAHNSDLEEKIMIYNDRIANLHQQQTDTEIQVANSRKAAEQGLQDYLVQIDKQREAAEKDSSLLLEELTQDAITQYEIIAKEQVAFYLENTLKYEAEQKLIQDTLDKVQRVTDAAVSLSKRQYEEAHELDFYRIHLSEQDKADIAALRSIIGQLHTPEAICKVIWKVYYERPTNTMLQHVLGSTAKTGIYKITNVHNQMCYVGQAANVADRWKQHIKRGVGAETPTRNKLYAALGEEGPESFTFELIEECSKAELNIQEDYWQEFYHAKEFGYSMK